MASSFLMLLDDIATVLDDVSVLAKVAAKKTSGVLGDDLALNAQQIIGVRAERELPIVWAVGKGSLLNKAILVPAALAISFFMPSLVTPLLMIGGAYLCFEGFEKVWHVVFHSKEDQKKHVEKHKEHLGLTPEKLVEIEKEKITGAVRTDFILSAEIIAITLGTVQESPLAVKAAVLAGIALAMTFGVYGLVAFIVKIDDIGLHLVTHAKDFGFKKLLGTSMLKFAPILMKFLSVAGTAAMFLVGGGIFTHGLPWIHHWSEQVVTNTAVGVLFDGVVGGVVGLICFLVFTAVQKFRKQPQAA